MSGFKTYIRVVHGPNGLTDVKEFLKSLRGTDCLGPFDIDDIDGVSDMVTVLAKKWKLIFSGPHDPALPYGAGGLGTAIKRDNLIGIINFPGGLLTVRADGLQNKTAFMNIIVLNVGGVFKALAYHGTKKSTLGDVKVYKRTVVGIYRK